MSINRLMGLFYVLLMTLFLVPSSVGSAENPAKDTSSDKTTVHKLLKHDLSPPLRDIPPVPRKSGVKRNHPIGHIPKPFAQPQIDGALQTSAAPSINAPSVAVQFNGIGSNNGYTVQSAPPDTNGDVSPTQYVQTVNTDIAVFNKSTGAYLLNPEPINTLWSGFGGLCQSDNDGDPTVTWDQLANRWIVTQFAVSGTTSAYLQCVAVSQSSDATGAWYRFAYSFGNQFPDYPKLGMMVDASNSAGGAYYQTFNLFNSAGTAFLGGDICAYNRAALLSGSSNSMLCYNVGTAYGGILAADLDGTTVAPSGSPEFVVGLGNDNLSLVYWTVSPNFSASTMAHTGPTSLSVASFTPACNGGTCVPQSGTSQQLDSLADRMMNRLQYRNFAGTIRMVASHSVQSGSTPSGVRWYQLNVSGSTISVSQQGTFSPDGTSRWMPSIAMDGSQNIAVGYSTSSSSLHPGIAYTGRIPTDSGNTMQAETIAFTGAGSQTGQSLSRWGDYSNMAVDPNDDCTFWFTTEYIPSNGAFNWATRIISFKFPSCGGSGGDTTPPSTSLTAPASGATLSGSVTVSANASDNVGVTNVEFYAGSTLIGNDTTSPYSITWNTTSVANGPYTLTSKAYDAANNSATSSGVNVTVNNVSGPPALTASYNSTYKAPACASGGKSCDTGASIINGRGSMTSGIEPNAPNTINSSCADGNSGTYHSDESIDRMSIATNDGTAFSGAKAVTASITVWCYSSADSLDLYYTNNVSSPTWTLINTQKCTASGVKTFTAPYTLPSTGTNQAVRATFRYNGSASACGTNSGYDDHDDLVFGVQQAADVTPPSTSISAPANGATVSNTVTVNATASDNVGVTKMEIYIDNVLKSSNTNSTSLTYSWNTTTYSNGNHTIISKAYDAANNIGTSSTVTVNVSNVATPPALTATYNSTLKAPACGSGGKSCDTGATIINGRGSMSGGIESNQPNTINSSCADGSSGSYHSDESIDRMSIATNDSSALAGGKPVTVSVIVWCWGTADSMDLYYTTNTSTPTWTLIGTQQCTSGGVAKTFTAGYTLPTGSTQQAVRATFRYNGSASACGTNSGYDDHDDLVFGVQ
jgi:hypothetical protein